MLMNLLAPRPLPALLVLGLSLCLAFSAEATGAVDSAQLAYFQRASSCTAVLKGQVVALQTRSQKGEAGLRAEMLRLAELSFTFVGRAYLRGLRKPQADQLLEAADQQLRDLSPEALRKLSADCQAQGSQLLQDANFLERALVKNRAAARVDKLLAPEPAPESASAPTPAPKPSPGPKPKT